MDSTDYIYEEEGKFYFDIEEDEDGNEEPRQGPFDTFDEADEAFQEWADENGLSEDEGDE